MLLAGTEVEVHHTVFLIWLKDSSPQSVLERSNSHETPKDIVCMWVKRRVTEGIKQLPEICPLQGATRRNPVGQGS